MNLADATLNALKGFAQEVQTWTNSGVLHSIEGHIAQIETAVATDIHAGETAAKAVFADLYGAFHGQAVTAASPETPAPAAPAAPTPALATGGVIQAPAPFVGESGPETVVPPSAPSAAPSEPTA